MTERFLNQHEAAEILGLPARRVYGMMRSGEIKSWCINPGSQRPRYRTTANALGQWQEAALIRPEKMRREVIGSEDEWFEWKDGKRRIKRRRA